MKNQIQVNLVTNIVLTNEELVFLQTPKLIEGTQTGILQWSKSNETKQDYFIWHQQH